MLTRAHPAHAIRVYFFLRFGVGDGARKIEQNPVWVYGCLNRRLHRRTQCHLDSYATSVAPNGYILYSRGSTCTLRDGTRHQEQGDRELLWNGGHVF